MPAHRSFSLAVLPATITLLIACGLASTTVAQVRMNLRTNMQITTMPSGFWPIEANAFATGDVDADGDLDLLAAMNFGGGVIWRNDGHGGFTDCIPLPAGRSRCCVLFDCDGDGDLDALLAGGGTAYSSPSLSALFRNDGTGAFTLSPTIPSSVNDALETGSLAVGDCDGDGDQDVVLFPFGPTHLRYWRNDGTGTFTDQSAAAFPGGAAGNGGTLADVEPDGDLDVVSWQLHRNNGLGVFTSEPGISWPMPVPNQVAVDVDGDTLIDDVGILHVPYVRRNLGGGVFQDVSTTWFEPHALVDHTHPSGFPHTACAAFDADGDGDPDLVTGGTEGLGTTSTTVGIPPKVYLNSNGQRFVDAGRPALPMLQGTVLASAVGDIDGDGDADLVLGDGWLGPAAANVYRQDGAGRFIAGAGALFAVGWPQSLFAALSLADVDADGDLDLIGITGDDYYPVVGQHRLALNDGQGIFTDVTATHMPPTASHSRACAVGDVDGDTDLDLVITAFNLNGPSNSAPLLLFCNDGAGVFSDCSAQLPSTPCYSAAVALRDFDGDGDRDLVARSASTHTVNFFANNGSGTFTDETATRIPATPPNGYGGLSVLDLNGDGDLDIAIDDVDLHNNGAGVFTAATVPGVRTLVVDFDEDGVPDALAGLTVVGGQTLFWDFNSNGHAVLPVDVDRDADLDLVVCPVGPYNNWMMVRVEVLYNLRRDLRVATLPRLGHPYRLQLRATNGANATAAFVAFATATLPQPIEIPGWGALRLDPAQMAVFASALIPDADTTAEVSMPIPSTPSLFGLPLSCQALFVPIGNEAATHLSNAMTFPLER